MERHAGEVSAADQRSIGDWLRRRYLWPDCQGELACNRCIARKLMLIEGRACMSAPFLAEHLDQQVRCSVEDFGGGCGGAMTRSPGT